MKLYKVVGTYSDGTIFTAGNGLTRDNAEALATLYNAVRGEIVCKVQRDKRDRQRNTHRK